jgi:hypothetical protein
MATAARRPRDRWPWSPVELAVDDVSAIKAMFAGTASPGQMVRGMEVIVEEIARTHKQSFAAGGEDGRRATDFGEGCRWVGLTLIGIRDVKLPGPKPRETGPHAVPVGAPPGES